MSAEKPKDDSELRNSAMDEVVGGTGKSLNVRSLAAVGGSSAQTENAAGNQKLYKVSYDGGSSEGWGPVFTAG